LQGSSRKWLLVGALVFGPVGLLAANTPAEEVADLKAKVRELEQTLQQLKTRIAGLETPSDSAPSAVAQVIASPTPPAASPPAVGPDPASPELEAQGFRPIVPSKTWIRIGGYAKIDAIANSTMMANPNLFITSGIPVRGEDQYGREGRFTIIAKQSRLSADIRSKLFPGETIRIFSDADCFANSAQPTMDFRIRMLYAQYRNITVGQANSAFFDGDANPDTLDFEGPATAGSNRRVQLRWTQPVCTDGMNVSLSLEQPPSDIGMLPAGGAVRHPVPDIVPQWRWDGTAGHVQLSGLLRGLSYEAPGGMADTKLAWGLNCAGAWKIRTGDMLKADFIVGKGLGPMIPDLPTGGSGYVDADGRIHPIYAATGMLSYQHSWSPRWYSVATYGYTKMENTAALGPLAYDHTHYAQANLIWLPSPDLLVGLEYLYGEKVVRDGRSGDAHRLQLSFKYYLFR
jgi:hypothetical protein